MVLRASQGPMQTWLCSAASEARASWLLLAEEAAETQRLNDFSAVIRKENAKGRAGQSIQNLHHSRFLSELYPRNLFLTGDLARELECLKRQETLTSDLPLAPTWCQDTQVIAQLECTAAYSWPSHTQAPQLKEDPQIQMWS